MLHKIGYPVIAVVHLNVAEWMFICFIENNDVPNLRDIRILRHGLCAVSQQEGTIIASVARLRAIAGVESCRLHAQTAIHCAMMTGARERMSVHPIGKLALVQGSGNILHRCRPGVGADRLRGVLELFFS